MQLKEKKEKKRKGEVTLAPCSLHYSFWRGVETVDPTDTKKWKNDKKKGIRGLNQRQPRKLKVLDCDVCMYTAFNHKVGPTSPQPTKQKLVLEN